MTDYMVIAGGKCAVLVLPRQLDVLPPVTSGLMCSHLLLVASPGGSFSVSLCLTHRDQTWDTETKQWAKKLKVRGVVRLRKGPLEQSEHQAQAISEVTVQIGSLPGKAEGSRKLAKVSGEISIAGKRLYGCPKKAWRVTGPKFPEPRLSLVARDSGYACWLRGTQGSSLPAAHSSVGQY